MPTALVLIADGTEEMEFTIVYDTLVRAGIECTSAGVISVIEEREPNRPFVCSRGVKIVPDAGFDETTTGKEYDLVVIPGGAKGADTISKDARVQKLVKDTLARKNLVGMICAGSLTALTSDLDKSYALTSHPSVKQQLSERFEYKEDYVVVSGELVTSRGPGTAFLFALKLVEMLCGPEKRKEVFEPMMLPPLGKDGM